MADEQQTAVTSLDASAESDRQQLSALRPPPSASSPVVDKSPQRVRRMFGEIAGRYDFLNHLLSLNVDRYWRWRTVRRAPPEGKAPILDICAGTGDLALAYGKRADGAAVIASDFCHEMLVIGRRKSQRAGATVTFVEADSLRLPFGDDTFQIVSVAFGLRNVADTDGGLREMARVCRPGGRVVVLEFSLPRRQPFRGLYGWYFRRVLPRIGQLFARNRYDAYRYLPASVSQFPERDALTARMRAAGLVDVTWRSFTFGVATLYIGRKAERGETEREERRD